MTSVLATRALAIGYTLGRGRAPRTVLDGLDLELPAGDLVCVLGPNGCGKSTLLRTLVGLQPPLSGSVLVGGESLGEMPLRRRARRVASVLTDRFPPPLLTVREVVAIGRHPHTGWLGRPSPRDDEAIEAALAVVGGGALAPRPFRELSDGERQRILVARALAQEPELLVLDEPTAHLDLPGRVETLALLKSLARRAGKGVLLSSHDLDLVLRTADEVWLVVPGARLVRGAPEDLVLSGALEASFAAKTVAFDEEAGGFRALAEVTGSVRLDGPPGRVLLWTRRALERDGIAVDAAATDSLEVIDPVAGRWLTTIGGEGTEHESLRSVIRSLGGRGAG